MTILAVDTSSTLCAAAVFDGGRELGREVRDIGKGHAEHLMGVIEAALAVSGKTYANLSRIVVAIGPGSFTGIRVGVATARGLALALKIPAFGVSNLEAVAAEAGEAFPERAVMSAFSSALGAVQVGVYLPFAKIVYDPETMNAPDALSIALRHNAVVAGSAAAMLAEIDQRIEAVSDRITADIGTYARLGALKTSGDKPKPLYLREPDAKPQASFVLPRAPQ